MRRSYLFAFMAFIAFSTFASAQSGNVFFGYSYGNINLNHGGSTGMNGFEGSLEGKVLPFVGLVVDIDGHYGDTSAFPTSSTTVPVAASQNNFLFGPRLSTSVGRFRPFAASSVRRFT